MNGNAARASRVWIRKRAWDIVARAVDLEMEWSRGYESEERAIVDKRQILQDMDASSRGLGKYGMDVNVFVHVKSIRLSSVK